MTLTASFTNLGLAEPLLKALAAENYLTPTPIQAQAIPPVLEGRDLFGIAQTGTGKTAAFALPIIQRLAADKRAAPRKGCRALVLSPTRELATQIAESFKTYGRFTGITVTTVFGGVGHAPQIRALARGVDVLVATPGRLLDHMGAGACDLSGTGILVLDEADQMLDLGFVKPIRTIVGKTSHRRQSLFFSATLPKEIEVLAGEMLRDPVSVRVTPVASTAERVEQKVIHVERARKAALLAKLLGEAGMVRTLVFTRTKRGADTVTKHLTKCGLNASAIHGNKSQSQRQQALEAFRTSKVQVLVATDIAARGIDISDVSHVVNYELPEVPEAYVHRIGRTARAGRSGKAISLCDPSERKLLRDIERLTRQTIPAEQAMTAGLVVEAAATHDDEPRSGRGGGWSSKRHGDQRGPSEKADGGHSSRGRGARNGGPRRGEAQNGAARSGAGRDASAHNGAGDAASRPAGHPARSKDAAHPPKHRNGESRGGRDGNTARADAGRNGNARNGAGDAARSRAEQPIRFGDASRPARPGNGDARSDRNGGSATRHDAGRNGNSHNGAGNAASRPAGQPIRFGDGTRPAQPRNGGAPQNGRNGGTTARPDAPRNGNARNGTGDAASRPAGQPARFKDGAHQPKHRPSEARGNGHQRGRDEASRGDGRRPGRRSGDQHPGRP